MAPHRRLRVLSEHCLALSQSGARGAGAASSRLIPVPTLEVVSSVAEKAQPMGRVPARVVPKALKPKKFQKFARMLQEAEAEGRLTPMEVLPGPWRDAKTFDDKMRLILEMMGASDAGANMLKYAEWQQRYGGRGLSSNIVVPEFSTHGMGKDKRDVILARVVLADPLDAQRLSQRHVLKEPSFQAFLGDSVISTTDNEHWRQQRGHLTEAFLPLSSLAQILPVSLARAKFCSERLSEMSASGAAVDMSSFLLHEAMAQLQMALLGRSESFMDKTNEGIRNLFGGKPGASPKELILTVQELMTKTDKNCTLPSDGCPVNGPVTRSVQSGDFGDTAKRGNILLLLFAGHDTTGHTMTWLLLELARHPSILADVQQEADTFFENLQGRDPSYQDLGQLRFLDRCITETLRLWPAVANGTFRQLQFADTVTGEHGQEVMLPQGTFINIVNWSRHRNPAVWGDDADRFNPHRDFRPAEIARVGGPLAAVSPESERFSPFAHAPRSCLGRNFAQMEMRLILSHLLHRFDFFLAPPHDVLAGVDSVMSAAAEGPSLFRGVNRGTMGPWDMQSKHDRARVSLMMHAHPRQR